MNESQVFIAGRLSLFFPMERDHLGSRYFRSGGRLPATVHTKIFERPKFIAISASQDDFDARRSLPSDIKEDLFWWRDVFADDSHHNVIRSGQLKRDISTDAALTGWGAVCGKDRTQRFLVGGQTKSHPPRQNHEPSIRWSAAEEHICQGEIARRRDNGAIENVPDCEG